MRSFAVLAMAAAATASYIPSSAPPAYEETPAPEPYYPASSSAEYPSYPESSSEAYPAYPVSSSAAYPAYPVSSSVEYPAYPVSSSVEYPAYETTTVTGVSTVCSETGTYTFGTKTYEVTKPTTIVDEECVYTTSYPAKPTGYPTKTPVHSVYQPTGYPVPSANGTHPTGYTPPTHTKPSTPEFTGAAGKASVGLLAIVGAVAAFL